mmetsp:Transcript_58036/g.188911  ORF Transcript_58036/g.188911 Transcript_58036/m.188911 type:complete len:262 (+) Transcript_58036:484-1269(+)
MLRRSAALLDPRPNLVPRTLEQGEVLLRLHVAPDEVDQDVQAVDGHELLLLLPPVRVLEPVVALHVREHGRRRGPGGALVGGGHRLKDVPGAVVLSPLKDVRQADHRPIPPDAHELQHVGGDEGHQDLADVAPGPDAEEAAAAALDTDLVLVLHDLLEAPEEIDAPEEATKASGQGPGASAQQLHDLEGEPQVASPLLRAAAPPAPRAGPEHLEGLADGGLGELRAEGEAGVAEGLQQEHEQIQHLDQEFLLLADAQADGG